MKKHEQEQEQKQDRTKIRLFTALKVPGDVQSLISNIPEEGLKGRWVNADDLHITVRFLGDIDMSCIAAITENLNRVRCKPFGVEIAGMSVFRSKKQTVLYADVKSTRKLTHLCAEVTDALEPLGFDFGTRYYKPHITLMRAPPGEKVEAFASRHGSKLKASWQAGSFYLLKSSRPENNANRYRELARYELS